MSITSGVEHHVTSLLRATNRAGGYPASLVCTEEGLLVASAGTGFDDELFAGFTALFDDLVTRADRDLGLNAIDDVSILDARWGRFIIRPLLTGYTPRMFLVGRVAHRASWRRNTSRLCSRLNAALRPLAQQEAE